MATTPETLAGSKPPQHKEVENFSDAERTEWLKTGKMPALDTDSSLEADASAASKPASKDGNVDGGKDSGSGPGKKARSQDENWRALEAERNTEREKREAAERKASEIERELEEYRTGKRKAEEKKVEAPKLLEMPKRPSMGAFRNAEGTLDFEKYEAALDKYETDKDAYVNQQVQVRTAAQQQEQYAKTWQGEIKEIYGKEIPIEGIKQVAEKLAGTQQSSPAVFVQLSTSKYFPQLVHVFQDQALLEKFIAQANDPKTFPDAVRVLRDMERDIEADLAKQPKTPKTEKLTKAGKPPVEAGGGSSTPEDDGSSDAAWNRKDLSPEARGELYRRRKNAEEIAKRKKRSN